MDILLDTLRYALNIFALIAGIALVLGAVTAVVFYAIEIGNQINDKWRHGWLVLVIAGVMGFSLLTGLLCSLLINLGSPPDG